MPKPAIHHVHIEAAASAEFLLDLTYDNRVFYSVHDDCFKVFPTGKPPSGYKAVFEMRQTSSNVTEFDRWIKDKIVVQQN